MVNEPVSNWGRLRAFIRVHSGRFRKYYLPYVFPDPTPETGLQELLAANVNREDVVVEVGGFVGGCTIALSSLCRQVDSFEPGDVNFRILKRKVRKFKNVRIHHAAVGSGDGWTEFNVATKRSTSVINSVQRVEGKGYTAKEKVRLVRLNSIAFNPKPTVMVLDCEGSENEVIRGASDLLPGVRLVMVETHLLDNQKDTKPELLSQLDHLGFLSEEQKLGIDSWIVGRRT